MPRSKISACAGFTLVETMVAAIILGMAITGVMSMLPIGMGYEKEDTLRRQATRIAANILERPRYHYSNYTGFANGVDEKPPAYTVTLKTTANTNVSAHVEILAQQEFDINYFRDAYEPDGTIIGVPTKQIEVKITWPTGAPTDSVFLQKTIARIQ